MGRGWAAQVVDIQVADANVWRGADAVSRLRRESHNPWAWVVNVDLGVTGVDSWQSNPIPAAQFHQVLDGVDGDLCKL